MKVLLVGYGSIGKRHYDLLKNNKDVSEIDVVTRYGCVTGNSFSDLYAIERGDLTQYSLFLLCSETRLHEEQLRYIDSQVKNKIILVEKPLANQALDLISKNSVYVTYNLRFHPVIQKLKVLLENERVLSFSVQSGQYLPSWRPSQDYRTSYSADLFRGGGVLRDLSHEIDYTQWLCGGLDLISAIAGSYSHLDLNSDDICTILAKNKLGTHIQIQMDYLSYRPKREIEIQTDNYTISACLISNCIRIYDRKGFVETINDEILDRNFTYLAMHSAVFENKLEKLTSFQEANDIMKIIDSITNNYMEKKWLLTN
jgi:predicted dehydrogenase